MTILWKPTLGVIVATAVATGAIVGSNRATAPAAPSAAALPDEGGLLQRLAASVSDETDDGQRQAQAIESLVGILDREVEERLRLEDEVDQLRQRLAGLERQLGSTPGPAAGPGAGDEPPGGGTRGEVNEARFVAAGFSESEAAYYRQRSDEAAMARLYLRDQAEREGWLGSQRYRDEMTAMPNFADELRAEMDDETYARYLYATGQPNQVRVRRVLSGSAAESAGIRVGDVLVSYDGDRLYDTRTVRRSTRTGSSGETVPVEVLRDGRRVQAYLPRGPIGITMSSESVVAENNRP